MEKYFLICTTLYFIVFLFSIYGIHKPKLNLALHIIEIFSIKVKHQSFALVLCLLGLLLLRGLGAEVEADDHNEDGHKEFGGDESGNAQVTEDQG